MQSAGWRSEVWVGRERVGTGVRAWVGEVISKPVHFRVGAGTSGVGTGF